MRQECRFFGTEFGTGAGVGAGSFPPMRGDIPDRARGLMAGLFWGQADVAQEVVVERGEAAALAEQGVELSEAVHEPNAACGADGAGGEDAEHEGGFHMMW